MKRIFLDINILIDLIADRKPFSKFAIAIFVKAEEKKVILFTSSHSIATTHYVLKKYIPEKEFRALIYKLLDYIRVVPIDDYILKKALLSKHGDFEDAIQIIAASSQAKMDCIVTRNVKDFKNAEIPVLAPEQVVDLI